MKRFSISTANEEYWNQAKMYSKRDALSAIILYIIIIFQYIFLGKLFLQLGSRLTENYIFTITGIASVITIGLVFLFCYIHKQKASTVGFSKENARLSFEFGISTFAGVVMFWIMIALTNNLSIKHDFLLICMRFIYMLVFIAFTEELVFRGYIGTRLYGYFKNKSLSIVVVGIMFALMHIPFRMILSGMSFIEYIGINWPNLIFTFILHLVFQWMYAKYNSIIAVTLIHFAWNYMQWLIN